MRRYIPTTYGKYGENKTAFPAPDFRGPLMGLGMQNARGFSPEKTSDDSWNFRTRELSFPDTDNYY